MDPLGILMPEANIVLDLAAENLLDGVRLLISHLAERGCIAEAEGKRLLAALEEREALGGTCLGHGVALPHAYVNGVSGVVLGMGRLARPVDCETPDGQSVDLLFLLGGPADAQRNHLPLLARLIRHLRHESLLEALRGAPDASAVKQALDAAERNHG